MKNHIKMINNPYIKKTPFPVISEFNNCFVSIEGNITKFNDSNIEIIALSIYNKISKNKGNLKYNKSIVEWLILNDYVLIKNSIAYYYLIPNDIQCRLIGCIWHNGSLIDRHSIKAKQIIKNRVKEKFSDFRNLK